MYDLYGNFHDVKITRRSRLLININYLLDSGKKSLIFSLRGVRSVSCNHVGPKGRIREEEGEVRNDAEGETGKGKTKEAERGRIRSWLIRT